MSHAQDCSAFLPCEDCSALIHDAKERRHVLGLVLEAMEEYQTMPWMIDKVDPFDFARRIVRGFYDDEDRLIPKRPY